MASAVSNSTPSTIKRKERTKPLRDNEDISCVQSPYLCLEAIKTPISSLEMKYLLLDRLRKEIISKLEKSRGSKRRRDDNNTETSIPESVVKSRLRVGANMVTRALENDKIHPSLIILARDVRPASIIEHLSFYAHIRKVPVLILPGKASIEVGEAVGVKRTAAVCFLHKDESLTFGDDENKIEEWNECNIDVDAFISYAISKIPSTVL